MTDTNKDTQPPKEESPFQTLARLKREKQEREAAANANQGLLIQSSQDQIAKDKSIMRHDLALVLSKDLTQEQAEAIKHDLCSDNFQFHVKIRKDEKKGDTILFIGLDNQELILQEAERLAFLKNKKAKTPQKEEEKNKLRKEQEEYLQSKIIKSERKKPFKKSHGQRYEGGTLNSILNEADKSRIVFSVFNNLKLNELQKIGRAFDKEKYQRDEQDTLISFLKVHGFVEELTPLHSKARAQTQSKVLKEALKHWLVPTELIREYYGDNVAMYFSWMNFLIKWLAAPGLLSVIIYIVNMFFWSNNDSPLNSIYAIFIAIWSTLYVIFWKRRCRGLNIEWDNHNVVVQEDDVRKEFQGTLQINPLTGRIEPLFTSKQRLARYVASIFMCAPYFAVIIFSNVCFLNLTGIIDPNKHHGLLQIEILSHLLEPGNFLDPKAGGFLPKILPMIQVNISIFMNEIFKKVANKATELENHRSQRDFDNSLILKRFAFMFCDYFLYLFYVGCYELRIDQLRSFLTFLFTIDEIRRLMTEAIIPYIKQWKKKKAKIAEHKKLNKDSHSSTPIDFKQTAEYIEEKEMEELEKAEYDCFDDYLEMIITFGYVTLFASAFPLTSFISMIFIIFEARSDLFKLEKLMKRPRVIKTYNIGSWIYVLEFMAFVSIFSNLILVTYASDQLDHLLPMLKYYRDDSVYGVVTIFTLEHILLVFVIVLRIIFDTDPAWVKLFFSRQRYQSEQKTLAKQQKARSALIGAKLTAGLLSKQTTMLDRQQTQS